MSVFVFVVDDNPVAGVTISDADKARIMAAYATLPGYGEVPVEFDPSANTNFDPSGNTNPDAEKRPRTEPEMWQAIAGGWLQGTLANVQRIEEDLKRQEIKVEPIVAEPLQPFDPSANAPKAAPKAKKKDKA